MRVRYTDSQRCIVNDGTFATYRGKHRPWNHPLGLTVWRRQRLWPKIITLNG